MLYPYLAKSTIKYKSPHATDLSFAKDETIRVTGPSPDDEDWLVGETLDGSKSGGFPKDFVLQIEEDEAAPEPVTAAAPPAEAADSVTAQEDPAPPPVPALEESPPSPKLEPAPLPATASPLPPVAPQAAAPVPAPAPANTQSVDPDSSPRQSMKDRLAFFAAAQNKTAPPIPSKPKPAAGGLTWSQRQKLRQEQEEKERAEREARGEEPLQPASTAPTSSATTGSSDAPPVTSNINSEAKKEGSGMSAADAASSIGAGGSLKERMAALRAGGAFGAPQEEKPAPTKPIGKVWSRPPAPPEPEPSGVEEDDVEKMKSPQREDGDGLAAASGEAEGGQQEEEDEEAQEKARRAAIAARMAKLGARGPMGMAAAIPPKPARKPTQEAFQSLQADEEGLSLNKAQTADQPEPIVSETSAVPADPSASAPTSVPIAAIPRRAAPPRRRGPGASVTAPPSVSEAEKRLETVDSNGDIEPPPQVMVADEEKPLPKTDDQLREEKEQEDVARGERGAEGAAAAGIALTRVDGDGEQKEQEGSQETTVDEEDRGISRVIDQGAGVITSQDSGLPRELEAGVQEGGPEKHELLEEAASGNINVQPANRSPVPPQPEAMVPLHPPASSGPVTNEEDDEAPLPLPHRGGMLGLPKDEVELKHEQDAAVSEEASEHAPAPAKVSQSESDRPLGPRPLPSPGRERALPPPPIGSSLVPPRDDDEGDEEDASGENEDEDTAPVPPPRRTTLPPPPTMRANPTMSDQGEELNVEEEVPAPPPPRRQATQASTMEAPAELGSVPAELGSVPAEDSEEDAPPPPPPQRKPSLPAPLQTSELATVGSPNSRAQSVQQSPTVIRSPVQPPRSPALVDQPAESAADGEDGERIRRANIAARMAKLGGIKFGAPPPMRKPSTSSEQPLSPNRENRTAIEGPVTDIEVLGEQEVPASSSPMVTGMDHGSNPDEEDEGPEDQAARRRATLARLRAGGALGFGMFNHGPAASEPQEDELGLPEEPEERLPTSPEAVSQPEEDDVPPPLPPAGRPPVPNNRSSFPPIPASSDQPADLEADDDAPPPPPSRPHRQPSVETPISPTGSRPPVPVTERRASAQISVSPVRQKFAPSAIDTSLSEEDATAASTTGHENDDAPPPPPPSNRSMAANVPPIQTQISPPVSPSHQRSISSASRFSSRSKTPGESPIMRQASIGQGVPTPRQSFQKQRQPSVDQQMQERQSMGESPIAGRGVGTGRPGYDALVSASRDSGARLARAARAMFDQGKKAYYGDGSPAGFVATAMDNAHISRSQSAWGQLVYEQEASSVLKRYDEPRAGDIAAFHDARLKGRKGISSYEQHVGSVEEPLVGVVADFEVKNKHKVKLLQVERGTPEEVSYRLDDLKSGRVAIYRPGL